MSAGLYSREVVAAFLGKRVAEIERMIEEDGLPAVPVPSGTAAPRHKFSASHLASWLNGRSKGRRWSVDEVRDELDRCSRGQGEEDLLKPTLERVVELGGLCEAAVRTLRSGHPCPRLVAAIAAVAEELKEGVA